MNTHAYGSDTAAYYLSRVNGRFFSLECCFVGGREFYAIDRY